MLTQKLFLPLFVLLTLLAALLLGGSDLAQANGPEEGYPLRPTQTEIVPQTGSSEAAAANQSPTVGDLPQQLQYTVSETIGRDRSAYQITPTGNHFQAKTGH
ncbi:MAG: hypothetical protein U0401_04530 [Anaerolineae bacterium]